MFFVAAGAAQTPKIGDFRGAQKPCITNPSAWRIAAVLDGFREVSNRMEIWVGLMEGFWYLACWDRTTQSHEPALESVSRGNFGRFMKRVSSRCWW